MSHPPCSEPDPVGLQGVNPKVVDAGAHVREHIVQVQCAHGLGKALGGQGAHKRGTELEVLGQIATLVHTWGGGKG
jgi:hypothetical protein